VTDPQPEPTRVDPDVQGGEAELLTGFLDYHRATFLRKVAGLTKEQMAQTTAASSLTLAGLTKHLALVEDSWFTERVAGRPMPEPWASAPFDDDRDWELHSAVEDDPGDLVELYLAACARSRAVVAEARDLDQLSVVPDGLAGKPFSLRWLLLHMLEETARHNGHADLLREAIDGRTGE
jgi:hypothetical protein